MSIRNVSGSGLKDSTSTTAYARTLLDDADSLAARTTLATPGLTTANVFTGQQTFAEVKDTVFTIVDAAAFEIDPLNGSVQTIVLGASRTPAATNFEAGQTVLLGVDDGAAFALTWTTVAPVWVRVGGTGVAPTLATAGYTWILFTKIGTVIYASEFGKP